MRVALVFPRTRYPSGDPPLGVAYIAACLRERAGITPVIIDTTFDRSPARRLRRELGPGFDLVGVSAMVTMADSAREASRIAKEANPDCLVVMGGPHATTLPLVALDDPAVDAACVGEGEEAMVEIARRGGIGGVPGIFTRDGAGGLAGEPRPPVTDLDALPFPALDLLPMDRYLEHWFQLDSVGPGLVGTSIMATRGCPFRCSYCQPTLDRIFGKGVRKRSPRNVVDELALRKKELGINAFLFADDTFIADRSWVLDFCGELERRRLGLKFGCNVRADLVTRELLETMAGAGLAKIYIGIEVYDDEHRRRIFNKKLTRSEVEDAVKWASELGVRAQGYFMLGAPGESRRDVRDTARYARRLALDDATFNLTTPLPGTYLFEEHADQVVARPEDMDYYRNWSFRPGGGLDRGWLHRAQVLAYAGFYASPRRLWRLCSRLTSAAEWKRLLNKLGRVL